MGLHIRRKKKQAIIRGGESISVVDELQQGLSEIFSKLDLKCASHHLELTAVSKAP